MAKPSQERGRGSRGLSISGLERPKLSPEQRRRAAASGGERRRFRAVFVTLGGRPWETEPRKKEREPRASEWGS
ncbi:hypothetical protein GQ457_07G011600 [Hibiscus cannabinus]